MPPGMQEIVSRRPDGKTVHRSRPERQDSLDIRGAVHRLRYLREKVSVRSHHDHQLAQQPGEGHHAPVLEKFVQTAQIAHAEAGRSVGIGRDEWYRQVDSVENTRGQAKTESRTFFRES